MKILWVSDNYYPAVGGRETQARLIASGLSERHEVQIATLSLALKFPKWSQRIKRTGLYGVLDAIGALEFLRKIRSSLFLPRYESYDDGRVHVNVVQFSFLDRLRLLPSAGRPNVDRDRYEAGYRQVYVPKLRRLMKGMDVVHLAADGFLGWAAEEAARAEGLPFAITPYLHPGQFDDEREANTPFYKRADRVFALLETDAEQLAAIGIDPRKIRISGVVPILPPSVDPEGFRDSNGVGDAPVVLFVGRMTEYKGPLAILQAAPIVWRSNPNVRFLFAGPAGEQEKQWFDNTDARIAYLGLISDQQKGDAMAACDLFCMPSRFEILPGVYLEAWAYAKPVIGGTANGLDALIAGNDAGVIEDHDPQSLAKTIVQLLADPMARKRMGDNGKRLVERRFSETAVVSAIEKSLLEIIREPKHASEAVLEGSRQ